MRESGVRWSAAGQACFSGGDKSDGPDVVDRPSLEILDRSDWTRVEGAT